MSEMHEYRTIDPIAEMPDTYLDQGHFWVQEYVTGQILRFQMEPSGLLTLGGPETIFDPDSIPLHYRQGVETLRAELDRDRLREGTESVDNYTFFGVVPLASGIGYEWSELPAFLGLDIWDGTNERFAPEDVTERVFNTVGLEPAPIFQKEVPARAIGADRYSIPEATWGEGPAAGILLRKKNDRPAFLNGESSHERPWQPQEAQQIDNQELETWVESAVTRETLESLQAELGMTPEQTTPNGVARAVATELARREFDSIGHIVESAPDRFETTIQERISSIERSG